MWMHYDSKRVAVINWPDGETLEGDNGVRELTCLYEYHGEYDDTWIVEKYEGKEIALHNMKFIKSVVWVV
jgi:hypothetical protein